MKAIGLKLSFVFLFVFMLLLPGFASASDDVPRITPEQLNTLISGEQGVFIIDVRRGIGNKQNPISIKGAVIKPLPELYRGEGLPEDLDTNIVTYCT